METIFYVLMGWCGTHYPGWRPRKKGPHPDPWKDYGILGLGIIAGAVGGIIFSNVILENQFFAGQNATASGLAAFATSGIITGLVSLVRE